MYREGSRARGAGEQAPGRDRASRLRGRAHRIGRLVRRLLVQLAVLLASCTAGLAVVVVPLAVPVCVVLGCAVAGLTWLLLRERLALADWLALDVVRTPLIVGGLSAGFIAALVGWLSAFGVAAGLPLLVLLLLAPAHRCLSRSRLWLLGPASAGGGVSHGDVSVREMLRTLLGDLDPAALSNDDLCQEWPATYDRLLLAVSAFERNYLLHRRRRMLLELERRNTEAFSSWLVCSADPASDLRPYLRDRSWHTRGGSGSAS